MEDSTRYISLGKNTYFDTQKKVLVEKVGNVMRIVSQDRRRENRPVTLERRKTPDEANPNWISLGQNIYYDKSREVIIKKIGTKMVLFSRNRRKENRNVSDDRRKNSKAS